MGRCVGRWVAPVQHQSAAAPVSLDTYPPPHHRPNNLATMPEKTQGFTEDQVEDFKEVFQLFDTKGDGLIQVRGVLIIKVR